MREVTVLSINTQASEQIRGNRFCDVRLCTPDGQTCSAKLLVDTGSVVSILPESTYLEHFKNALLTEPKLHLVTYLKKIDHWSWLSSSTGSTQPCFCAFSSDFLIVPSGTPILGKDLFTALGLNIVNGCVTPASVLSTSVHQTSAWQTSHPNVTGTLGYAKGFVHRVKIRPNVVPIQ